MADGHRYTPHWPQALLAKRLKMGDAMKWSAALLAVILPIAGANRMAPASPTMGWTFHVAPGEYPGGVQGMPGRPFNSIEAALRAARDTRGWVTISLRSGHYPLERGLRFGPEFSRPLRKEPLVIAPEKGATVTFFGGTVLQREWFSPVRDRKFLDRLVDPAARSKVLVVDLKKHGIDAKKLGAPSAHGWSMEPPDRVPPSTLSIGGRRMTLARWPNEGVESDFMTYRHFLHEQRELVGYELKIQEIIDRVPLPGEVTYTTVVDPGDAFADKRDFNSPGRGGTIRVAFDRMKHWGDIENVFLDGVLSSTWEWTYNRLASVDVKAKTITLAHPELHGLGQGESVRLPHFHFDNIPEELDVPGEYWIDRERGLLYLIPPDGFDDGPIVLSTLDEPMITVDGASGIVFENLRFASGRTLGIDIRNSSDIVVNQCEIANMGQGGVLARGSRIGIYGSEIRGVGGYGVHLAGGDFESLEGGGNEVVNCSLHDFGWDQKSQLPGVMIDGVGHRVAHCNIYDGPHFAIRLRRTNDVIIEYNEIHDLPKYHFFDGGALYVYNSHFAQSRGNEIRHNYFHDIPTIGVYPDNFSWGIKTYGNVFRNVGVVGGRPAVMVNGGGECRTFNNLMIDCPLIHGQGARRKEPRWMTLWNKTLEKYGDGKVASTPYAKYDDFKTWLAKKEPDEFYRPTSHVSNNVLFNPTVKTIMRGGLRGIDDRSKTLDVGDNWVTTTDPGLADFANGDLSLRPDSEVFKRLPGFKPIQFSRMGRQSERE